MGIRRCDLRAASRGGWQSKRGSQGPTEPSALGTLSLGRLSPLYFFAERCFSSWTGQETATGLGEFACAEFEAGSQSEHENIHRHHVGARFWRVGFCKGPEKKRICESHTAEPLSTGGKDL